MAIGYGDKVGELLQRILSGRINRIQVAPPNPPDVFAAAGYLLQVSGAYHHVQPEGDYIGTSSPRILHIRKPERAAASRVGRVWRALPVTPFAAPAEVQTLWNELWRFAGEPVFVELAPSDQCPPWWKIALQLFMIADCAVMDEVGWVPVRKLRDAWLPVKTIVRQEMNTDRGLLSTLAFETNQDIVNVLPKARTPSVGCTLRSLSHNLALLPPRGVARAYWVSPVERDLPRSDALNLLVVPFPYRISAISFEPKTPLARVRKREWGWFKLAPTWLDGLFPDDIIEWLTLLSAQARKDCGEIHGIVLPELALDWVTYNRLIAKLKNERGFELLISGLCSNMDGRIGNFVATTMFGRQGTDNPTIRIREKHHRWKLDSAQIGGYALSSALQPTAHWWEKLDIMSRSVDVFVFRKDSSLTTLICEDLARVDPCQELVRSIGPNLVIALLMDSAQIKDRWPARYATVLSEDPGCSVLTVTSKALVERVNDEGEWERSNATALWRDDTGKLRSIDLPREMDAIVLTLAGHARQSRTLDGRIAKNSMSWRYHGQQPICVDAPADLRRRVRGD